MIFHEAALFSGLVVVPALFLFLIVHLVRDISRSKITDNISQQEYKQTQLNQMEKLFTNISSAQQSDIGVSVLQWRKLFEDKQLRDIEELRAPPRAPDFKPYPRRMH